MKRIKSGLLLLVILPCLMSAGIMVDGATSQSASGGGVYICVSSGAKRYHCYSDCRGLNSCKHTIKKVSVDKAQSMGLTPCRVCY